MTDSGNATEGWRLLLDAMVALARAEQQGSGWTRFAEAFAAEAAARGADPGASPFDPAGWLRPPGQGGMADLWRWLEGPGFADVLTEERAAIRATGEWLALAAAWAQYAKVMGEGWVAALRRFAQALAEQPGHDDPLALWREVADAELAAIQTSPACLAAQRDLISADLAVRAMLRGRIERVAAHLGLPTRAELDDLHAQMHALRRELRALRNSGTPPGDGAVP